MTIGKRLAQLTCSLCQLAISDAQAALSSMRRDGAKPACKDCVTKELTEAKVDYEVSGSGTLYIVTPLNMRARENLKANVSNEAQWFAGGVAVEHRYVIQLVEQLTEEGWVVK